MANIRAQQGSPFLGKVLHEAEGSFIWGSCRMQQEVQPCSACLWVNNLLPLDKADDLFLVTKLSVFSFISTSMGLFNCDQQMLRLFYWESSERNKDCGICQ